MKKAICSKLEAMRNLITLLVLSLCAAAAHSQSPLLPASRLIDSVHSAWPDILAQSKQATNKIAVLPTLASAAKNTISELQQSTQTALGAVVYHTGGIMVDDGWIRILGAGHSEIKRNLVTWNRNKATSQKIKLLADDAIGGFFILNLGDLGIDTGMVYYLSPKALSYQPMSINYKEFLTFCFNGDLNQFYSGLRWKTWRQDLKQLTTDQVFVFLPFLWSKSKQDLGARVKQAIPAEEKYFLLLQEIKSRKMMH